MEIGQKNYRTWFTISLFLYILSIQIFSYRAGFVFITYGLFAILLTTSLPKAKGKIQVSLLFKYMFGLLFVFGVSTVASTYMSSSIRRWITMLLMFLTCIAIEIGFSDYKAEDFFDYFSNAIIHSCILTFFYDFITVGPYAYLEYIITGSRLTAVASQTNVMGVYGAIAFNVMFYEILVNKKKKIIPLLLFPLLMILASQSKKAILCVLMGVFLMLALRYRKRKITGLIVLLIFIVLFVYLSNLPIFESIMSRFTSAFSTVSSNSNDVADWSTYYRIQMIKRGLELFKQKPLFGHGTDTYGFISGFDTYSHNNYIELLANNGIIGFIAYYWVYLYAIWKLIKRVTKDNDSRSILLLVLLVTTLLLDYGEVSYYNKMTYIYISWVLIYLTKIQKTHIYSI